MQTARLNPSCVLEARFVSKEVMVQPIPLSPIPESGKGRGESEGGDIEPRILFLDSSIPPYPIPVSRFRVKGSGIRV